jgi:hypothetical protein
MVVSAIVFLAIGLFANRAAEYSLPYTSSETTLVALAAALFVAGLLIGVLSFTSLRTTTIIVIAVGLSFVAGAIEVPFYTAFQAVQVGSDRFGQCSTLEEVATASNLIPKSASNPKYSAISCEVINRGLFLRPYNLIKIYGLTTESPQNEILGHLSNVQRRVQTFPIMVEFYDAENWTEMPSNNRVMIGKRGAEHICRVAIIG